MAYSSAAPAASGTSTSVLDVLTRQDLNPEIINQICYAEAPWMDLAYTATMDKLLPGNIMKFITIDGEYNWSPKEYNALPVFQQVEAGQITAQLCPPNELGLKVDSDLIKGRESEYMKAFDLTLNNTLKRLNQTYFKMIINQLLTGASPFNQGNNAGKQGGGIKLGTVGAPLVINVATGQSPADIYRSILDVVVNMMSVKSQLNLSSCVASWKLAVHEELVLNFAYAQSTNNMVDMSQSVMAQGVRTYSNLFGQETVSSTLMPKIATGTNGSFKTPLILFNTQATAWTGGISSAYKDEEFATQRYILAETHGGAVLRPEWIQVAWVELRRA